MKNKKLSNFLLSNNMLIVYIILAFSIVVSIVQPAFLGPATLVNLLTSGLYTMCFVLCEMLIMITGGIDVSFPAIACVSMYVPMYLFNNGLIPDNGLLFILIAIACGLLFGLLNGVLVSYLRIPALVATLATSTLASGGLAFIFGVKTLTNVPTLLKSIYDIQLFVYTDTETGINYPLSILILVPIILCIVISFILRKTMLGRGLYATGGNIEAARIVGFPVKRLEFFTYAFSGVIASITAVMYVVLMQSASTTAHMGRELLVVAACVVGGCTLTGGYGSVGGAILGTLLITLIQNNLNMLSIDTKWQTLAVGVVLLLGVLMTAIQGKIRIKKRSGGNI